jgi:GTP pyrophosphokinase
MVQINQLYHKIISGEMKSTGWLETLVTTNKYLNLADITKVIDFIDSKSDQHDLAINLEIATTLIDLNMDTESIKVGLLLNLIRKNIISLDAVQKVFGKEVCVLIDGVIRMDAIAGIQEKLDLVDNQIDTDVKVDQIRKMLIAMVKDPRVVVIRLAEHLSELRLIATASEEARQKLATETKLIYAPLANRLGIGQIKWQLEDYAFRYLSPDVYKKIAKLLDEKRIDRDNYITNIIEELKTRLAAENIQCEVTGRVKHIYSIWRKMQRKNIEFDELYDIRAVRILTNNITDCYAALGLVHGAWRHIPKEFDDYIATPKDNGYQSLHTAVFGPKGKIIEIQIRTHSMHNDSELGVAAHWRYKEGVAHDKSFESKIAWLRQLIEWQDEVASTSDLLEELKTGINEDRVYVLTPKGDVFDLPEGATPLDLAYLVHTEIGHKCCGAKVNAKMVSLTYTLATGDQVEILTRNNSRPSRDWLNPHFNFIKTPRARSKVQAWFKRQDFGHNVIDGKEILERELQRIGVDHVNFDQILPKLNFKTEEDVLAALARGDIRLSHILHAANIDINKKSALEQELPIVSILTSATKADSAKIRSSGKGINILGVDNLLTSIAGCCKPIPGNSIIGYVSQGRGITIHCDDCLNIEQIKDKHPERLIDVSWGSNAESMRFAVDIFLKSRDRQGLLRDVTSLISGEKANILNLKTDTDKDSMVHTYITLEINSLEYLNKLLDKLQALPNVLQAQRLREGSH